MLSLATFVEFIILILIKIFARVSKVLKAFLNKLSLRLSYAFVFIFNLKETWFTDAVKAVILLVKENLQRSVHKLLRCISWNLRCKIRSYHGLEGMSEDWYTRGLLPPHLWFQPRVHIQTLQSRLKSMIPLHLIFMRKYFFHLWTFELGKENRSGNDWEVKHLKWVDTEEFMERRDGN